MTIPPKRPESPVRDPGLPLKLNLEILPRIFRAVGVLGEQTLVSLVDDAEGYHEIVDVVLPQGTVKGFPHRKNSAVRTNATTPFALRSFDDSLKGSVGIRRLGDIPIFRHGVFRVSRHQPDIRVVEVTRHLQDRVRRINGVRVRKNDDLPLGKFDRLVQTGGLSPSRLLHDQTNTIFLEGTGDFIGSVTRIIRHNDDVQKLPGIVRGQYIPDLRPDDILFVIGRDDDRNGLRGPTPLLVGNRTFALLPFHRGKEGDDRGETEVSIEGTVYPDPEQEDADIRVAHSDRMLGCSAFHQVDVQINVMIHHVLKIKLLYCPLATTSGE
jgi:hypothetical protein